MDDRYDYSGISEKSKQFAISDISENPQQINAHVESFRRWLKSMPHLNCPTNSTFLLRFLRVAKFDHKRAQKRLDNFCTVRSSPRGSPEFFKQFDINDPIVKYYLDLKIQTPLGRNDAGELIVLIRPKQWDMDKVSIQQFSVLAFMGIDVMVSEEETQIHGMRVLIDLQDVSRKSMEVWGDPKFMKKWNRIMQESYPMRMKGQIFYNEPVIFDIVFQVATFFMNEKMKSRTFRVKNDITKAIEKIPGLEKILPSEYMGQGGTLDECAARWHKRFKEYYANGNPLGGISVDESKRPQETTSYLVEYGDYKGQTLGTAGTFTKFENVF